jgi:diacylglycerol kinase (ATP)
MMKKVHVIVHGRHEHSSSWMTNWKKWQANTDYQLTIAYTQHAGHAQQLTVQAVNDQVDVIVAAGGDGTINECVNGYLEANAEIPLSFLAMGTGNDFIKTLHQSGTWQEVDSLIKQFRIAVVDVGEVHFINGEGVESKRYFINVMDIGLGGEVVQKIAKSKRRWGPFLTYQKAILSSLIPYKQWMVDFQLDSACFREPTLMLAMANAKWFGSGLGIAPMAQLQDGYFSVIHMGKITLLDYLKQLPKVKRLEVLKHDAIRYFKASEVKVLTHHLPIDCDGEFIGFTPLQCKIIPNRLKLLSSGKECL